jgi:hypothetical protein
MSQPAPEGGLSSLSPDRQRAAVIGGAGLIVLLLFFFVIRPALFGGGGGGGTTTPQPPLARPRVTTTTRLPSALPSESFEIFTTKNPFTPLVNPAGTGGGTTGTTVPGGGPATTVAGGGGATATTAPPGAGASGGAATEPRRSQRVALLNVYQAGGRTVADVRVNDTVYPRLAPGATFAGNFKVVSLQGSCGTFLFGDERFQLCKGEEVLK